MTTPAAFSRCEFGIVGRTRSTAREGSAVAAAAYNLCASAIDAAGRRYDFSRKRAEHVAHAVLLPPGAPPELRDPGNLWRAAEAAERRADAQLARQVLLSVPREVPAELRLAWVEAIAAPWVADGVAVQIDLHAPRAADGGEQPHAHLLLSLRRVSEAGVAKAKAREWNQAFREDQGRAERARIQQRANDWLAARGIAARIDLRSLAAQGEDRPPEPSAPRADWQRWIREGADPAAAPITVAAALTHRARRSSLSAAEADVAAAAADAADLRRQLAARLDPVESTAPLATARRRAAHAVTQQPQEAPMARRPQQQRTPDHRSPPSRHLPRAEPWMRRAGGLDALPPVHRQAAERSYAAWAVQKPGLARRHDLEDYVSYVQGRQAERLEPPEPPQPEEAAPGIGPAATATGDAARHAHLAALLAERYPAPSGDLAAFVSRYEADPASRTATLHLTGGGRIHDHGDRLELAGALTPEAARALVAAAAAHGWSPAAITGPAEFRAAVAEAAALREPPLLTDYPLPPAAQERVAQAIRERAQAAVPALDREAMATLAAADPKAAAHQVLAHAEERARAALAGRPNGSTDPEAIAAPRLAELAERRATAREDATEAAAAAAQHRGEHGILARLRDPSVRRRQAALDAEAGRLGREADRLDKGHSKAVRGVEQAARREALAHAAAMEDWRYSPAARKAQGQLAAVQQARAAIERGDEAAIAAAARGDLRAARQAAQQPRQAASPANPREAAVLALAAVEQQHAQDPAALVRARATTAAAVAGDPATVEAAARGDVQAAQRAAQEWQERQRREEEDRRRDRAAVLARAPQQPHAAGPGL